MTEFDIVTKGFKKVCEPDKIAWWLLGYEVCQLFYTIIDQEFEQFSNIVHSFVFSGQIYLSFSQTGKGCNNYCPVVPSYFLYP